MARIVSDWPAADLREHYRKSFGLDIAPYLTADRVVLEEDEATGLRRFRGCLPGDAAFYDHLSRSDWYYMRDRWEHSFAAGYLAATRPGASVLDVGCGDGDFLDLVRSRGFDRLAGLEFNPSALATCAKRGLAVTDRTLAEVIEAGERFDVVTAFQVLEHVPDPVGFIREIAAVTRPGGTIILATPNRDTFTRRFAWDLLDMPPHHMSRWNEAAYRAVAAQLGLTVKAVTFEPVAPYHRGWYLSSYIQWVPLAFKLRAVATRLSSLVRLPEPFWQGRRGHTILVELAVPAGS